MMAPDVTGALASFGTLLRRYRVVAGLSQEELAQRAHMSARGISDLERGVRRAPYRGTVMQLAEALALTGEEREILEQAAGRQRVPGPSSRPGDSRPDEPLLAIKLAVPAPRDTLVERGGLIERLAAGLRGPLTVLSAPAGSGKTTLLGAWRATAGRDALLAWLSLDAGDNDPARFWRYVLAALGRAHPGLSRSTEDLLRSPQLPAPTSLLTRLSNELATATVDIVLALDDYHLIENRAIHEAVGSLLEHLPACLHLLLSSRADPPLPLARLRAAGAVTELRAADLRFSEAEARTFFRDVMNLPLPPEAVAALEARTEGWIAGLQLAALSLQGRPPEAIAPFVAAFAGSHRYVVDYLVDEVLLRQPAEAQRFLLHTCIPPRRLL